MAVRDLMPWNRSRGLPVQGGDGHPLWALNREMNRLFDDFLGDFDLSGRASRALAWPGGRGSTSWPTVELEETDSELKVRADLPGMEEKDVEVLLNEGVLTIRGEKKSETEDKERRISERFYGAFERRIPLPAEVDEDKVAASFKNGELTVTMPKSPKAEEKAKRIKIN